MSKNYIFEKGCSRSGLDFPHLLVDMKVTSVQLPQSSCPFNSAREKIYGLGYDLLVFIYERTNDHTARSTKLDIVHTIYIDKNRTADYQTTRGILDILDRDGDVDDITSFFSDRNLPVDDIMAKKLAEEILKKPPNQGYLTISNALQWRLQYGKIINSTDTISGIWRN